MTKIHDDFLARFKGKISLIDRGGQFGLALKQSTPIEKRPRYTRIPADESFCQPGDSEVLYRFPMLRPRFEPSENLRRACLPARAGPRLVLRQCAVGNSVGSLSAGRSYITPLPEPQQIPMATDAGRRVLDMSFLRGKIEAMHGNSSRNGYGRTKGVNNTFDTQVRELEPAMPHKYTEFRGCNRIMNHKELRSYREQERERERNGYLTNLSTINTSRENLAAGEESLRNRSVGRHVKLAQGQDSPLLRKLRYRLRARGENEHAEVRLPLLLKNRGWNE